MSRTEKLLVLGILIDNSLQERMRRLKGQSREIYVTYFRRITITETLYISSYRRKIKRHDRYKLLNH
jgi:hypothetical protein